MEIDLQGELSRIRNELLAGTYKPLPARRVYIPKASDKKKLRPLGIPSLRGSVVRFRGGASRKHATRERHQDAQRQAKLDARSS